MALTDDQKTEAESLNESVFESTSLHRPNAGMGRVSPMGSGTYGGHTKWEGKDPATGVWSDFYVLALVLALLLSFCTGARAQTTQPESTTSLGFIKPEYVPGSWGDKINQNWDLLNQQLVGRPEAIDCDLETQSLLYDNDADTWICGTDNSAILDLGDDAANESTAIVEFATTGDTESIFTEPSADKILFDATKVVSPDRTQTLTAKTLTKPKLTAYSTASLPACTENEKATLADGGAAGSVIQCDAANTWRCQSEYTHNVKNILCPPFNADPAATDATNRTALQLLATEMQTFNTGSRPLAWSAYMGEDCLEINGTVTFDTAPNTSSLWSAWSYGNGCLTFTGSDSYGMKFGGGAAANNVLRFTNMTFNRGTNSPTSLLWCDDCVQVWFDNVKFADMETNGIKFTGNNGHVHFTNSNITENSVHAINGAAINLDGSMSEMTIVNSMVEGAVNGSLLSVLRLEANASLGIFNFTGNQHTGSALWSFIDMSENNITLNGCNISGNVGSEIVGYGFDLRGLNSNTQTDCVITKNVIKGCADACGTTVAGIAVFDATRFTIKDNQITRFPTGVALDGTTTQSIVKDNICEDVDTYCVDLGGAYSDNEISGVFCDGCATADVNVDGTSSGRNYVGNVVATDGSNPILVTTGLAHATDTLELAPRVQSSTCADSGDGNPGAVTITPVYNKVQITNSDANGCNITMAETLGNGQRTSLTLTSTAGGNTAFADSAGVLEMAAGATFNMGSVPDNLQLEYLSGTTDTWYEVSRSDN